MDQKRLLRAQNYVILNDVGVTASCDNTLTCNQKDVSSMLTHENS